MRRFVLIFLSSLILLLSSCTVTQNISLQGSSYTEIESTQFLEDVMSDLSCWTGERSDNALMEVALLSFADNLYETNVSKDLEIEKTGQSTYNIGFSFNSLEDLVNKLSGNRYQDIIVVSNNNGKRRIDLKISLENYCTLCEIIPVLKDPNLEVYGPLYNNPPYKEKTEEDYLYMIDVIFGTGSQDIVKSSISIDLDVNSPILATNGLIKSDNVVNFSFPLIDFLLLHRPIEFWCEY